MKFITVIFFGLLLSASSLNDPRRANEAFQRGDFEEAVRLYQEAIAQDPDNPRLLFNLGNALSKLGQTEEAINAFEEFKRRTESAQEQSLADYNKGRLLSDKEQYDEALNHFREALRKNPNDDDARHNYELAQRRLQEQQQEPESQPDSDQDQDGDEDQDQDNQDQNQDGDDEQEQDQQQSPPQEQDTDQQQDETEQMTREEAENLLDALEQLERELLENRKKEASENRSRNDRDW